MSIRLNASVSTDSWEKQLFFAILDIFNVRSKWIIASYNIFAFPLNWNCSS